MPGSVAIGTWRRPSKVRCSYTSSAIDHEIVPDGSVSDRRSSSGVKTLPVGLCGVFSRMALQRGVMAASNSAGSNVQPAPARLSVTVLRVAPPSAMQAVYES